MKKRLLVSMLMASVALPVAVTVRPSGLEVAPATAMATEDGEERYGWIDLVCDLCDCCEWFERYLDD
ncbi:MAG: hypothetical protein EHM19_10740 [Candidatus Latescibacterota bacterium]|nr:MAG: hypothetical protein EHM19_10740 [Candidatus Latescibacterota bacterium]